MLIFEIGLAGKCIYINVFTTSFLVQCHFQTFMHQHKMLIGYHRKTPINYFENYSKHISDSSTQSTVQYVQSHKQETAIDKPFS